ncbi:hypothetical protein TNCV_747681 [Trichonephila clavipes]|nr:hypothetical protein TNCV_747681 [Trichonephila clavipes]
MYRVEVLEVYVHLFMRAVGCDFILLNDSPRPVGRRISVRFIDLWCRQTYSCGVPCQPTKQKRYRPSGIVVSATDCRAIRPGFVSRKRGRRNKEETTRIVKGQVMASPPRQCSGSFRVVYQEVSR